MATPEKQPGLSFFLSFPYVAALQTARESGRLEILKALGSGGLSALVGFARLDK